MKNNRYGKWVLLEKIKDSRKWSAMCDCGNICEVWIGNLRTGKSKQCVKCQAKNLSKTTHLKTHGLSVKHNNLYAVWGGIKRRCYNKNQKSYKDYGAKGVIMCDEWRKDFVVFFNWACENGYKKGLEVSRKKDKGNYSPENCSLKTRAENMKERVYVPTLETLNKDSMRKTNLSWDDMCWIIKFGTSGRFSNKNLSEMFSVARHTITDIIKRNGFTPRYNTRKYL